MQAARLPWGSGSCGRTRLALEPPHRVSPTRPHAVRSIECEHKDYPTVGNINATVQVSPQYSEQEHSEARKVQSLMQDGRTVLRTTLSFGAAALRPRCCWKNPASAASIRSPTRKPATKANSDHLHHIRRARHTGSTHSLKEMTTKSLEPTWWMTSHRLGQERRLLRRKTEHTESIMSHLGSSPCNRNFLPSNCCSG